MMFDHSVRAIHLTNWSIFLEILSITVLFLQIAVTCAYLLIASNEITSEKDLICHKISLFAGFEIVRYKKTNLFWGGGQKN